MSLIWRGAQVVNKVAEAGRWAVDKTMSECVRLAKAELYPGHGFKFGVLQGSLRMESAVTVGAEARGRWGSFDVEYAQYIEEGDGRFTGYGYLRGAADTEYPKLAGRIAERMRR